MASSDYGPQDHCQGSNDFLLRNFFDTKVYDVRNRQDTWKRFAWPVFWKIIRFEASVTTGPTNSFPLSLIEAKKRALCSQRCLKRARAYRSSLSPKSIVQQSWPFMTGISGFSWIQRLRVPGKDAPLCTAVLLRGVILTASNIGGAQRES